MSINDKDQKVEGLLNRRDFFKRAAIVGAVAAGAGTVLAACEKKEGGAGAAGAGDEAPEAQAGGGGGDEFSCMDTEGLEPAQIKVRESLEYVDKTPKPEEDCANCMHWKPEGDNECGGCAIVPGPIHPDGWCNSWVAAT